MILLIRLIALEPVGRSNKFTFHYDSINSTGAVLDGYAVCEFTFHYDSITSLLKKINLSVYFY